MTDGVESIKSDRHIQFDPSVKAQWSQGHQARKFLR